MLRSIGIVVVVAALGAAALWWSRSGSDHVEAGPDLPASPPPLAETAPTQAPVVAARPFSNVAAAPMYDAIVVGPCNLSPLDEQEVSSQVDGTLKQVLVDLGQRVQADELLAQLDDRLLQHQVALLKIRAGSESARLIAKAQLDDLQSRLVTAQGLVAKKAMAREEFRSLQFQRDRYAEEVKKALDDQTIAGKELQKSLHTVELHQIRSVVAGEVTKVYKRTGESVRQAEPLFCITRLDRLRIEGLCKVQQAALLRPGMRALVEPETRSEQMTTLSGHTAAVTCLALSPDGRVLASASEDRTVRLWDAATRTSHAVLPHPGEVYAVAFLPGSSGASGYQLLTAAADGRIRSWLVGSSGSVQPQTWPSGHDAAIRCLALSADGALCASGGDDRRIALWDTATGKLRGWLKGGEEGIDTAHFGVITCVRFTSDGKLISAARDNSLKVWQLGGDTAKLVNTHLGRSGDLSQLDVSAVGHRVTFDHGEELRLLDYGDGSSQGSLRSRRQGRFQAFATFSPTGRLLLTGANNGQLQLWCAPAPPEEVAAVREAYRAASAATKRPWPLDGYELRQYVQPAPAPQACGVFAPDEKMAFTGGADGMIHVWAVPPAAHWQQPLEAAITYIGSQVERGTDMVRVRGEVDNPSDLSRRLRPGTYINLRLYPEAK